MYCVNRCECEKGLNPRGPRSRALHPRSLGETGKLQAPLRCVFAVSIHFAFARSVHCIGILRKCEGSDPFHTRTDSHNTKGRRISAASILFIRSFIATSYYSMISVTTPDPTVLPPSRIANLSPSSIAIGVISSISITTLSPGMHISVPSGR